MTIKNSATAQYQGIGKDGKGTVSTQSGAFNNQPYGLNTRFEGAKGTNPEEQIAAAHASCFTMALSFGLGDKGLSKGQLDTKATVSLEQDGDGFTVTKSELVLKAKIAGISEQDFTEAANAAKLHCPISKLLNCDITLSIESFEAL